MNTDWQYAWSEPSNTGDLKTHAQDFYVEEQLGFEPDGKGEFCYVFIEKLGVNTDFLAKRLAQLAGIAANKVTYSGVKDRHACTRQWFCLHTLNEEPDLSDLHQAFREPESVRLIAQLRHSKKLKTGTHFANRFIIRLRNVAGDLEELEARLQLVQQGGVPNYYGPQRFGINGNNLHNGKEFVLKGRQSRRKLSKTESFWLSAIRSWCFNQALSDQVENGMWDRLCDADIAQFQHKEEQFRVQQRSALMHLSVARGQISPVLPLLSPGWEGGTGPQREAAIKASLADYGELVEALMDFGLSRDSRLARLVPMNMAWELLKEETGEAQLILEFSLPKGCFATSILREMMNFTDKSAEKYHENSDRE
ncbi:tRNA pseudouridine(13) synthase TruD [Marinomonas posidonica]|uniref:tRNA pseudouridine synthase D n=1 Tax=Marinomonas posidonica (strain CECT 7376 / NCIMB 14433 / IVIA-Po-181) TaxID=491952 RepID=F6CY01_MARPP|nr:tRNA pseudouridine(13) synthase TruD [Marinomonas posidonica]AEF55633.1 tRNA pseudouridine synthase D [Marinomonas posidonica IVIA-Po-181]